MHSGPVTIHSKPSEPLRVQVGVSMCKSQLYMRINLLVNRIHLHGQLLTLYHRQRSGTNDLTPSVLIYCVCSDQSRSAAVRMTSVCPVDTLTNTWSIEYTLPGQSCMLSTASVAVRMTSLCRTILYARVGPGGQSRTRIPTSSIVYA